MQVRTIKLVILRNESEEDHARWVRACENFDGEIQYKIINLTKNNWLDKITNFAPDILLTKPGGLTAPFKQLYDERLMILVKELGYNCFPTLDEVLIYENKRYFSYWLKANNINHPRTNVFYFQDEAIEFLKTIDFPIVGKTNIGASGSGVVILHNHDQTVEYINRAFSRKGALKRIGPNFEMGSIVRRGFRYILNPRGIIGKLKEYRSIASDVQSGFVILQEFIPHDFEWRVVRMGNFFFAHKKVKMGDKASGSLLKNYDNPPLKILDFVRKITDRFGFYSQAIDIFETYGEYLINEMQCIFGQSDPYQMLVSGNPGRYVYRENQWFFEPGDFNTNESYDLRLKVALELYENRQ